ncbi:hypothetical protein [Bacteroides thetaiotaomicron]|uniref:hypothetical protein n=1 Tax=Bacteroides thetaiotaomicron TaxID=818 RepID=UPI003219289D
MRTLIILIFLLFSYSLKAQITSALSFNENTKTIFLKLENQTDSIIFLAPKLGESNTNGTYFMIKYKDKNERTIDSLSTYVFDLLKYSILLPKKNRDYKLKLYPKANLKINSVDIEVHIEARNAIKTLFIDDICKTYKWK